MELTEAMAKVAALQRPRADLSNTASSLAVDIFISYAMPDDEPLASDLELRLEVAGFRVWRATKVRPGEVLPAAIRKALTAARAIVVVWTPRSAEKDWVCAEAEFAREHGKLVPLRSRDMARAAIPPPFNTVKTLAFEDEIGLADTLAHLGVVPMIRS